MTDATITVTNLGDRGVRAVFGVIYPPQVALVGFGKISDRVWDVDGGIGIRPVVTATLSADHRATDGHIGARFLADDRAPPAPSGGAVMTTDPDAAIRAALASIAPEADLDDARARRRPAGGARSRLDGLPELPHRAREVDRRRDPRVRLPPRPHLRGLPRLPRAADSRLSPTPP